MEEQSRQREVVQAKNLHERIFAKDKNARALIYVGYGHLAKTSKSPTLPMMMGTLLRQKLGENATLHVDQERFHAHADRSRELPLYRPLLAKFPSDKPFVLRRKDGTIPVLAGYEYYVDMQVIFPDYRIENGRPQWLSTLADRTAQTIPAKLLPTKGERLILAYGKQQGPGAVPIDAVLVEAGKPPPVLMLPKGDVRLETQD
jgi:hypothetical protein